VPRDAKPVRGAARARRRLSHYLVDFRQKTDKTQKEVALDIGWSESKLQRVEKGLVGVIKTDLKALLDYYDVHDEELRKTVNALAQEGRQIPFSKKYGDIISKDFATFLDYEESADVVFQYETKLIPGLLQIREYAYEVLKAYTFSKDQDDLLDRRVALRLENQKFLESEWQNFHFIIDESALWREVGGSLSMIEQLQYLKRIANRPNITIQIVPFGVGAYPAMRGPYVLLEFDDPEEEPLLFLEGATGDAVKRENSEEIFRYGQIFKDMRENLSSQPEELDSFLDRIIDQLSGEKRA
jgi:transcriptional regulator with XRE-family HTH domain